MVRVYICRDKLSQKVGACHVRCFQCGVRGHLLVVFLVKGCNKKSYELAAVSSDIVLRVGQLLVQELYGDKLLFLGQIGGVVLEHAEVLP